MWKDGKEYVEINKDWLFILVYDKEENEDDEVCVEEDRRMKWM